jgi:hypothetical protein
MESSSRYLCGLVILSVFLTLSMGVAVSVGTDIIKIISVNYLDPDQWVEIANDGTGSMDLTGWTLMNMENQTFSIPGNFTLKAGSLVRIHGGKGNNTASDLYNSSLMWNRNGDTAILKDATGKIFSEYQYPIKVSALENMTNIKPIFLPNAFSIGTSPTVQAIQSDYNAQRGSLKSNVPVNLTGRPFICHGGPLNWAWTIGLR